MLKTELVTARRPHTSSPVFSVVIPAYNAVQYIPNALDSVFEQTFNDYEVIVVNDGSPDTQELERLLQPYITRVTYLKQHNKGPGAARNAGIRQAKGEYIALLDSDDRWLPNHLAEMMTVLQEDPTLDLVYADALNFGDQVTPVQPVMDTNPSYGPVNFESLVEEQCCVISSCVVVRRQAIIEVGLFDENLIYGEDFDLWLRLAHCGKRIDYLRNVHALRRIHDENLTCDTVRSYQGQVDVLKKMTRELTVSDSLKRKMNLVIERSNAFIALENCKQKIVARQYKRAREELERANGFFQRRKLWLALLLLRTAPTLVRHFYVKHWS
jgi:glycosyltransferase involved in cell wall biosynthesis